MFGDNLKRMRISHGLSQEDLANKLEVSQKTISSWETNRTEPNMGIVQQIADMFGITTDQLIFGLDHAKGNLPSVPETLLEKIQNHMSPVPFYERLCCGNGMFADDQIADYIFFSDSLMNPDKEYFCMTASGDSMIGAQIQDGDYLVFEKTGTPQLNKIGCFCIDDNVATCKKFTQKNGLIILIPANDQFEPIIIDPTKESHFRCVGVLAFVVSDRR